MKELMGEPYIGTAKMARSTKMSEMDREEKKGARKKKSSRGRFKKESIEKFMQRRNMEGAV